MVSNPLSLKTTCPGSLLSTAGNSSSSAEISASAGDVDFESSADLVVVSGILVALLHLVFVDSIAKSLNSCPISAYF